MKSVCAPCIWIVYTLACSVLTDQVVGQPPPRNAGGGMIVPGTTKQGGDETITIRFKDSAGENQTLTASTGMTGSKHRGDDLPKGMNPEKKAVRIADSINAVAGGNFTAVANGPIVSIDANETGVREMTSIRMNGTTGEKEYVKTIRPAGTVVTSTAQTLTPPTNKATQGRDRTVPVTPQWYAQFTLSGSISGIDDDGLQSLVTVEIADGTLGTLFSRTYLLGPATGIMTAATLRTQIVNDLRAATPYAFAVSVEDATIDVGIPDGSYGIGFQVTDTSLLPGSAVEHGYRYE